MVHTCVFVSLSVDMSRRYDTEGFMGGSQPAIRATVTQTQRCVTMSCMGMAGWESGLPTDTHCNTCGEMVSGTMYQQYTWSSTGSHHDNRL